MHTYLPALLRASETLLDALADDPSAWGVSAAFIGLELELEHAFVAWCGIVGEFFIDRPSARRKIVKAPKSPPATPSRRTHTTDELEAPRPIRPEGFAPFGPDAWRKSMPVSGSYPESVRPPSAPATPMSTDTFGRVRGGKAARSEDGGRKKTSRPSVRELAIQPVQRVMRYVLQYRGGHLYQSCGVIVADGELPDLLNHTPATAPARSAVERALEGALRIAQKCDQAQKNSAFLQQQRP